MKNAGTVRHIRAGRAPKTHERIGPPELKRVDQGLAIAAADPRQYARSHAAQARAASETLQEEKLKAGSVHSNAQRADAAGSSTGAKPGSRTNPSPAHGGRDTIMRRPRCQPVKTTGQEDAAGERQAGPDPVETPGSPVDGAKPAKGRIESNPMSAARWSCVCCARSTGKVALSENLRVAERRVPGEPRCMTRGGRRTE